MRKTTLRLLMTVIAVVGFAFYGNAQYLTESFEGTFPPTDWAIVNNGSGNDWVQSTSTASDGSNSMQYAYDSSNPADAWAFTPAITLTNGSVIQIYFDYKVASSSYPEKLKITVGSDQTVATQTTTLWDNNGGSDLTNSSFETAMITYTVPADGDYYFAFNCYSDANEWNLFVDNVIIQDAPNCPDPSAQAVSDILTTSVTLSWTSGNTETAWNVEYGAAGFGQGTGTTVAATDTFINITGLTAQTDYDFYVQADCGGDQSAWVGPFSFTTACDAINIFPYTEDFDGGWDCWTVVNNDADSYEWSQSSTYLTPHSGAYVAHGMGNNDDYLISPQFTLNAGMEIRWWDVVESSTYNNTYDVLLSTTTSDISSFTVNLGTFDCTNTDWVEHVINLTGYTGNVYIAFHQTYSGASYYGFGIDDFLLQDGPTCFVPTNLDVQNLGPTSVDLTWTTGGASEWGVLFGVSPFDTTGVTSSATTSNPLTVDTLTAETTYEYYVRDICGAGDSSVWAGPFTFTTTASCPVPTDLTVTGITSSSADLGWNGYTATNWDILFGIAGFDTTGMAITADDITNNPLTVDTLQSATTYEFYVRADCGQDNIDTSNWVGPFAFTTECDVVTTFPWIEDFEDNGTDLPICFNNVEGTWQMSTESYSGTYAARITYSHSNPAHLESPDFILPANHKISFMWKDDDVSVAKVADHDTTFFEISTDDGANWITLDTLSAPSSESNYHMAEHDLSAYAGTFKFRFRDVSDASFSAYGTGVDSIVIRENDIIDLALVMPGNEDYSDCSFTGQDTIPFFVENAGNAVIAANDTIFAWYELDGAAAVADTFIIATDLNPTDTMYAFFAQTGNLAGLTTHDFKVYFEYEPGTDMNQVNDTTVGTVTHYMLTVDLGGVNDTIATNSYPYTLDAGANFDSYLWNDGSMNQTLDVSVDGWYDVLVTDTNGCDAFDSVYVQLTIGINTIDGISLNIYPNPNKGEFTLNANFNTATDFTVEIINLNGKAIYTKEFNGVDAINEAIDIDEYSKGVYYVRIVNDSFVKQEKVIVY